MTSTQATFQADPTDPRHGKAAGYNNLRCRCTKCSAAWANYCFDRRYQRDPADAPHGTLGGYQNWRCRCRACKDAHAVAALAYRRRAPIEQAVEAAS